MCPTDPNQLPGSQRLPMGLSVVSGALLGVGAALACHFLLQYWLTGFLSPSVLHVTVRIFSAVVGTACTILIEMVVFEAASRSSHRQTMEPETDVLTPTQHRLLRLIEPCLDESTAAGAGKERIRWN